MYLLERRAAVRAHALKSRAWQRVNDVHERALAFMHAMPRIWLDYCQFLSDQRLVTRTREAFDRALRALPVTQHERVWQAYLAFVRRVNMPALAVRVQRRYLKLNRFAIHDYVDYLVGAGFFDEAARQLVVAIDNNYLPAAPTPKEGEARGEAAAAAAAATADPERALWLKLVELVAKNASRVRSVRLEPVVRSALTRFKADTARLWIALADHSIRIGNFDKARDVFEEALASVVAVRDFSQIWDAYSRFEDELIAAQLEQQQQQQEGDDAEDADPVEFELRLARYERLVERQPFLLNSVLLRQNPHSVHEWHKRVALFKAKGDSASMLRTYREALATVEARHADGKLHSLWLAYAETFEARGELETARQILRQATAAPYHSVDELATVWCAFAEFELRHGNVRGARDLIRDAIGAARPASLDEAHVASASAAARLTRSVRLWSLYVDLEESVGTFESTCAAYDEMLRIKVATPQAVLCYAQFLEQHKHWERSFQAFERGVALFKFPFAREIFAAYLSKFVARYGGRKLERARDLFEQAIAAAPQSDATLFYVMYANLEETHGLARHAMAIYKRAAAAVPEADRARMYLLYIARATERFGVAKTREIYEQALEALGDHEAVAMALRYAALELRLGEVDRARAIYVHASQLAHPRRERVFWQRWRDFEVRVGNEDTFAEMLRIKRSVEALLATEVNVAVLDMAATQHAADERDKATGDMMSQVEAAAAAARVAEQRENAAFAAAQQQQQQQQQRMDEDDNDVDANEGDDDDDDEDVEKADAIETKAVPASVFQGVQSGGGARERLLAKRKRDGGGEQ
jgi:pre-mRNA-splicing factor SYF1